MADHEQPTPDDAQTDHTSASEPEVVVEIGTLPTKTSLRPMWLIKMGIFFIVGMVFFVWGYLDATTIYPKRAETYSQFMLKSYLQQASETDPKPIALLGASVMDPAAALERLESAPQGSLSPLDASKLIWLESLKILHGDLSELTAQNNAAAAENGKPTEDTVTFFVNPPETLRALAPLDGRTPPAKLATYDIPVQWAITLVGLLVVLVTGFRVITTLPVRYWYDPATRTLTLPGRRELTPDDIALVDKRKWDKFYVFLKLKDSGEEIRLDLYRFIPLEQWILDMEPHTEGYEPDEDDDEAEDGSADPTA